MLGLLSGTINGLLGAGGGTLIVPTLNKTGLSSKQSHANSVVIILFTCIFSSISYISKGYVTIHDAMPFVVWGIIGSIIGSKILPKISGPALRKIFGIFMLWCSVRMWFK